MKEQLDDYLDKYFADILDKKKFTKYDSFFSAMGALYKFSNDDLKFEIINDRGIIEILLSSNNSKNSFDFELINIYLKEKLNHPITYNNYNLSERLELKIIRNIFIENYDEIKFLFNEKHYKNTEVQLFKLAEERASLLFGNKKET